MKNATILLLLFFTCSITLSANAKKASNNTSYKVLCYHDIRDDVDSDLDQDQTAVHSQHLIQHFDWLKRNNYHPVSLTDIENAYKGIKSLPSNPVLLTFDDGFKSFYDRVYPLLKIYNYPAIFSIVTSWVGKKNSANKTDTSKYNLPPNNSFLSWKDIKEMSDSGLVEIASHSHNLHKGIQGNPQKNMQPAAVTRHYNPELNTYEADSQYKQRLIADFRLSSKLIEKHTGTKPRAFTWPYGHYSQEAWDLAKQEGFTYSLILKGQSPNKLGAQLIQRKIILANPTIESFQDLLNPKKTDIPKRAVHVDLDYIYDPDPAQQHKNLSSLVDRLYNMKINIVFLQAFADPDGDGNADALYFPNRHLPMRSDLFNRVAWQLHTRVVIDGMGSIHVYAWMPVSAFDINSKTYQAYGVQALIGNKAMPSNDNYKRLSIFSPFTKKIVGEIYEDLGKHAFFNGLLFHDDAFLSDFEDLHPSALKYYKSKGITFSSLSELKASPKKFAAWTKLKTSALIDFTEMLKKQTMRYRPNIKTARNIYAAPIINTESENWFAQNLISFANNYDIVAIMAMPFMEEADNHKVWLQNLIDKTIVQSIPTEKILFELQTVDWRKKENKHIDEEILISQIKILQNNNIMNYGYYPDDFILDLPRLQKIKSYMSLNDFPYKE